MTESCWDYPRPPRLEPSRRRVRVLDPAGQLLADVPAGAAWRVLETSHPPTYYVPGDAVAAGRLRPGRGSSWCEWKGQAAYVDLVDADGEPLVPSVAWTYPAPTPGFEALAGALAFYPSRVRCLLDDEQVAAQEGDFYGGWISSEVSGPFKGGPGTLGW
ncbi:DUF427 domain-containing protein [Kineococcus rhizosphaerae]|uniref:Uncharacterized protein (DUF427 family) n=1 Tax=Kineococcus rhizosphaerae TaxID=559628 RepID=A0A2T0R1G2_9ACTN|nr:DUF427 domain-containing protein [Kineococcus rhizosphaerae]PRY13363.1 uncharacterized protein (DUF427 family) [Kineococcus rhizosphaerae]